MRRSLSDITVSDFIRKLSYGEDAFEVGREENNREENKKGNPPCI
jgi:hypothetical protein